MKPIGVLLVAMALGLGGAACGQEKFTSDERVQISEFEFYVATNIARGAAYSELLASIDTVVALYRAKPEATYDGRTMEEILKDAASDLDAYKPDLAAQLDRAVR